MLELQNPTHHLASLGFHGSYRPEDVTFLLQTAHIQPTDVAEKEYLIQTGQMHYSQMISLEAAPSTAQWAHYQHALQHGAARLAQEVQQLGNALQQRFSQQPIILVSLVRAGVPLGVLLKHHISATQRCHHYGISIIRDRGIDFAALEAIIHQHGAENIVFVDGWTGKGAICQELTDSLQDYPQLFDAGYSIPRLVTLSDLAGYAWLSASCDDWLIPFGILGSVVSGLTSRSILQDSITRTDAQQHCFNPKYWHSCLLYQHLQDDDISVAFTESILSLMRAAPTQDSVHWNEEIRLQQQQRCQDTMQWLAAQYDVQNMNRIKPSIAEATRAVLRRVPERILLRDADNPHLQLLLHFAQQQNIAVDFLGDQLGPYDAVTLIKKVEKQP